MSMPIQIDQKHALTTRQTANRTDGFSSTELHLDWQIHPGLKCNMALCFQHNIIISPDTKKQQQQQQRNQQFKTNSIGCDSFAVKFALSIYFFLLPWCLARHSNSYLESNNFFFMAFFFTTDRTTKCVLFRAFRMHEHETFSSFCFVFNCNLRKKHEIWRKASWLYYLFSCHNNGRCDQLVSTRNCTNFVFLDSCLASHPYSHSYSYSYSLTRVISVLSFKVCSDHIF